MAQKGTIEVRTTSAGEKRYRASYRDVVGFKRNRTFDTRSEAEAFLRKELAFIEAKKRADMSSERYPETFLDLVRDHTALIYSDVRPNTLKWVTSINNKHLVPTFGEMLLRDITPQAITRWKVELQRTHSAATVRSMLGVLKRYLAYAHDSGFMAENPGRKVTRPVVSTKRIVPLSYAEVKTLVKHLPDARYSAFLWVMAFGGLRFSEAAGLTARNIGVDAKTVTVQSQLDRTERKLVDPKTRAGVRTIPLPGPVSDILKAHVEAYKPRHLLFTLPDGYTPLDYANFRKHQWLIALEKSELEKTLHQKITMHDLRHSAVSHWIASGATVLQVAAWAGHTSPDFTLRQYGHLFPDDGSAVMARLQERMA